MSGEHNTVNARRGVNQAEITARRIRAWELRISGKSIRGIAGELEVSASQVFKDLEAHAKEIKQAPAEELRKLELQRLDMLVEKLWSRAETGDPQAVGAFLKVMERRAKYLGLDAPTKVEATVHQVDAQDTALAELINEHKAKVAAEAQALRDGAE
jgi:phage terminase small subunit